MMGGVSLRQRIALELQRQLTLNCAREHPLREIFWECTLRCCLECRHCGSDCKVTSGLKDMLSLTLKWCSGVLMRPMARRTRW